MIMKLLEISEAPETSNEPETLGSVLEEFNIAVELKVTQKSERLEMKDSASIEMAAKNILNKGFGKTKVCVLVTST